MFPLKHMPILHVSSCLDGFQKQLKTYFHTSISSISIGDLPLPYINNRNWRNSSYFVWTFDQQKRMRNGYYPYSSRTLLIMYPGLNQLREDFWLQLPERWLGGAGAWSGHFGPFRGMIWFSPQGSEHFYSIRRIVEGETSILNVKQHCVDNVI